MFGEELDGATVVLAVAQKPFEKDSESGIWNNFATLLPVLHEDGRRAEPAEFPDNGDVWWMVVPPKRGLAEPGRLLTGTLELSKFVGQPGKAHYQVRVDSVEATRPSQIVELIDVPVEWASEPRGLVSGNRPLRLDHPPLTVVYASWRDNLYGPLHATSESAGEDIGDWLVKLTPANPDNTVLQVPVKLLEAIPSDRNHQITVRVSLTNQPPARVHRAHACRYHLVSAEDFRGIIPPSVTQLVLQSEDKILRDAAKKLLTRSKRQQLLQLLHEMLATGGAAMDVTNEVTSVVQALRGRLESEERYAEELAQALLESGTLAEQIDQGKARAEAEHVEKHAARLQTEIEEEVKIVQAELAALEKTKQRHAEELESLRRKGLADLEREQDQRREEFNLGLREQEERLNSQKRELERQRDLLSNNLKQVAAELAGNRDNLVNQFLAISPLLHQLDLLPAGRDRVSVIPATTPAANPRPRFELPVFAIGGALAPPVSEAEFFDRFCKHVEASGFKHRRLDLATFHLSVKCNDLTVLGGLPGTGKSSLSGLYAEALAGNVDEGGVQRYLHVGVSPSWLDIRDLLGHANALDHCFQPAESGLYQHLIWAQEEEAQCGLDSRFYVVCLDEMNLAQVEHYFSGFIQALERPHGKREVRCFSLEVVSADDPFARWPTLNLPRNLRFIGTVNFDETTRQLSQRVLDRANLIRLRPPSLLDAKDPAPVLVTGGCVTIRQFRDWIEPSPKLDRSLAELIDKLREPLTQLGCPLNPRRFNVIRKFISSAPPEVCRPEEALDLQIAQRVLPQVRNLFRPGARDAVDALKKILETQSAGFPESLHWLEEVRAAGHPAEFFGEGLAE